MVIPRSSSSVPQNLAEFHDITFEGQLGFFFFVSHKNKFPLFYWEEMKQGVHDFVPRL